MIVGLAAKAVQKEPRLAVVGLGVVAAVLWTNAAAHAGQKLDTAMNQSVAAIDPAAGGKPYQPPPAATLGSFFTSFWR